MGHLRNIKESIFPKGIQRSVQRNFQRILRRTSSKTLTACFQRLEIPTGSVICIHSMLSSLGYLVGGPSIVIDALRKAVPECTVLAPTFPFGDTTATYLAGNPVMNRDTTPSQSGLLTEVMRCYPGASRSYHPTHPCVAVGPQADVLIYGSEYSETPFGDESSYGRYSRLDNAYQLLINTNSTSIVHRFQEIVEMPNLFLPDPYPAKYIDSTGKISVTRVKVHVPVLPLYVIVEGDREGEKFYMWFPNYVLPFPEFNRLRIETNLGISRTREALFSRHSAMIGSGAFRMTRLHEAEIIAIHVKPWCKRICDDLKQNIEHFRNDYKYEAMLRAKEEGLLHH